ncbi:unnamed protein product [Pylaiella littoralis]
MNKSPNKCVLYIAQHSPLRTTYFDPTMTGGTSLLLQRIALGTMCAAMHLAFTQAFFPSTSLYSSSASSWTHLSSMARSTQGSNKATAVCGRTGAAMTAGEHDLFVVGAGYLGKKVGTLWNAKHPDAKMIGETRSFTRHGNSMPSGMTHARRKHREEQGIKMPNVVFCANPGEGNSDYAREVFRAVEEVWDGTGVFLFTSSGSVYAEQNGGTVTEDSPIDEAKVDGPLRIAEKVALRGGGIVVRLAGLYSVERGPHKVWLDQKRMNHHSQGQINLISYDDAAAAVVAALDAGIAQGKGEEDAPEVKGQVFLAAEGSPITRQKICEVALAHPMYGRKKMPIFQQDASPIDCTDAGAKKVYDSSASRKILGWEPKYSGMEEYFMADEDALEDGTRVRDPALNSANE